MRDLVKEIDELITERSLLKHPFYQKWTEGTLELDSLAGYSREYYQLARAVPGFVESIALRAPEDADHESISEVIGEERDHIALWEKFATSLGVDAGALRADGKPKTMRAVSDMRSLMQSFAGGACAMYAFEKEIPEISRTKLDGLSAFYNITSPESTEYFEVHTTADIRHAAVWRRIIESSPDHSEMMDIASRSLDAQNLLLDSCYESYC